MANVYKVEDLSTWNMSLSMLIGKSPKIEYLCGKCGGYNRTRIPINSIKIGKPYARCGLCGAINDTGLTMGR